MRTATACSDPTAPTATSRPRPPPNPARPMTCVISRRRGSRYAGSVVKEGVMATEDREPQSRPPLMQAVFDNPFILLVIGLAVPIVFYTIWGLLEIASIPLAR